MSMKHLLNSCAVSSSLASREEDDAIAWGGPAARRLLLGIPEKRCEHLCAVSLVATRENQLL